MEQAISIVKAISKKEIYEGLLPQIESLVAQEKNLIPNLANVSAALKMNFNSYTWVGFYLVKKGENENEELVLGPFQGKPACVRIQIGKGACGTAVLKKESIIIPDVDKFPGHIYCDPSSKSEIVIPILKNNSVIGVIDVDSDVLNNFDETDRIYLEKLSQIIAKKS